MKSIPKPRCIVYDGMNIYASSVTGRLSLLSMCPDSNSREIVLNALSKSFRVMPIHISKFNRD